MAGQRDCFIADAKRALTDYSSRSGLNSTYPIAEGLGKMHRRCSDAFDSIERERDGARIYASMLPLPDKDAVITTREGVSVHILMSKLFRASDHGRLGALLYLLKEDTMRIFLVYQSQSHCMWRIAPAGTTGWFGKSDDQNQLNLPWRIQLILDGQAIQAREAIKAGKESVILHSGLFNYLILQPGLYPFYHEACETVLHEVRRGPDAPHLTMGGAINVPSGMSVDAFEWPTQGKITRVRFESLDGKLRYHFVISPYGFGMSSAEEREPFNKYGLRPIPMFVRSMIRPFTDYRQEIDEAIVYLDYPYALRNPKRVVDDLVQRVDGVQVVPKEVLRILNSLRIGLMRACPELQHMEEKISRKWEEAISSHS